MFDELTGKLARSTRGFFTYIQGTWFKERCKSYWEVVKGRGKNLDKSRDDSSNMAINLRESSEAKL